MISNFFIVRMRVGGWGLWLSYFFNFLMFVFIVGVIVLFIIFIIDVGLVFFVGYFVFEEIFGKLL